jgi:dipeptidyl aminopeptidase/acylaminoacyl peptidase
MKAIRIGLCRPRLLAGLLIAAGAATIAAGPAPAPVLPAAIAPTEPSRAAVAKPPIIPVEAFGALPFLDQPEVSPDGHRAVAGSVVAGKKALILADLDAADYAIRTIRLPDSVEIISSRWAGNGRVLISLLVPIKFAGTDIKLIRLFVFDIASQTLRPLADKVGGFDGDNIIFVDPAGAYVLLSTQRSIFDWPSVLRVDLATRKAAELVAPHDYVRSWFADSNGVVRGGMGREAEHWWLLYRETADGDFKKIAKGNAAGQFDDIEQFIPAPGSDKGYVIANRGSGRFGVYRYDFVNAAIGDPVFENPDVDVESITFSSRTGALDSVTFVDDRDRVFWLDPPMAKLQARLDTALPGYINRIVSRSDDDSRVIVQSTGAADPGIYYVFDRAKSQLRRLARPFASLDEKPLAPMSTIHYAARDGLSIPAYLTLPLGRTPKNLPLLVMPHGGPFVRDKWEYNPWVQLLANRGYVVLQPNYRGSTGYGKSFVEAATGQWGRKMQDDLDDGVAWLVRQGTVDPKRVCIIGASYGGYAAMWAAARNPDIYRCAISFAGISDMKALMRYDASNFVAKRYFQDWRDRVKGEAHFDLDGISPIEHVADVHIPLLIAHGKSDTTVPPSQSIRMHDALDKAGRVNEFVLYPDEGHGFSKVEDSVDFLKRVDAFLARYNPPD